MTHLDYELVVGLEIHAELITQSKMFCGCAAVQEAAEPNTHICPTCTGLPGAMPTINGGVVRQAILVGLALNCQINPLMMFARKNYYYPDLPKGFQITQYDLPLATGGWLEVEDEDGVTRRIRVRQVHIEEDTARLYHVPGYALVDFNRSGVPLLEIVSQPDMRSVAEVESYATQVRDILRYLSVNSGEMEKGVLRFEANVSVRPHGTEPLGTRIEIKNLNSFRALRQAVSYEFERQVAALQGGMPLYQETRGWDDDRQVTYSQREKEGALDYRYFPEPDLPPVEIERGWVEEIRAALPELPRAKEQRFTEDYGLTPEEARALVSERALADYFEASATLYRGKTRTVANWILGALMALLNETDTPVQEAKVRPEHLAELLGMIDDSTINQTVAKEILDVVFATGTAPGAIVRERGFSVIADTSQLERVIRQVLGANPEEVRAYVEGKETVFEWFVGQVMRQTGGQADAQVAREILQKELGRLRGEQ